MPSVDENLATWTAHDWSRGGEEWSRVWGGTQNLWWGTLFPRISRFFPASNAVEIAPGAGRISARLADWCDQLTLVDMTPVCVELCRRRFADRKNVRTVLNDGRSLPGIADGSIDFAFSFDSLVHVDLEILTCYLAEFRRVLAPRGVAFVHHSNFGRFVDPDTNAASIPNLHWRDPSVSATAISARAEDLGLRTLVQEEVNWGCDDLIDAFSLFARADDFEDEALRRVENLDFMKEAEGLSRTSAAWTVAGLDPFAAFDARARTAKGGLFKFWKGSDRK